MKSPPPSALLSTKQWAIAGLYTTLYKLPELAHLLAFTMVRQLRKSRASNERLLHLERYFLNRAESYHHRWGHAFCSSFGINVQIESRLKVDVTPNERILFVQLNQQSMIENPVFAIASDDLFECKKCSINKRLLPNYFLFQNIEFALLPLYGWNPALIGVVIRRGNKQSTRAGIERLLQRVNTFNDRFVISVEGKRSKDGRLNAYKMGAATIAVQTKSDIIPVSFRYTDQIWPHGQWRIRSGQVTMVIHDRISTKEFTLNDREMLTQKLRDLAERELSLMNN